MVIDAHHHLWNYQPEKHQWIDDTMTSIRRDFKGEELAKVLSEHDVSGTVLVQVDQSEAETFWLVEQAIKFPFILGVVGWVDLRSDQIPHRLAHFSTFSIIKGFRHIAQAEPDDFLLGDAFQQGLDFLQDFNFTYDLLIYPTQLESAIRLVEEFPDQLFVIDHLAKPLIKEDLLEPWARNIKIISQFPNVFCKVSGMITEADHRDWTYEQLVPYLDIVFESFGVNRLMFGSDWPVCLLAGQYDQVLSVVERYISKFSQQEKDLILRENATNFYNL
jgi:L-fuconolactonase